MDTDEVIKEARSIELNSPGENVFFLIHGYTGSPTDFNNLGNYLHKRFSANVMVPRIIGHGTKMSDLDRLDYDDILENIENKFKKEVGKNMNIVIGGLSLGGLVALDLAARYPVRGIINISTSYDFKFPINLIRSIVPLLPFKYARKPEHNLDKRVKTGAYTYPSTLLKGFKVISQAKKRINSRLGKIWVPCLFIHNKKDKVIDYKGDNVIMAKISSRIKKCIVFPPDTDNEHNLFYSSHQDRIYQVIGDFVEENNLIKSE